MKPAGRHLEAMKARQAAISLLRLCVCLYPLDRHRNGSGHDRSCPAHTEWVARKRGVA